MLPLPDDVRGEGVADLNDLHPFQLVNQLPVRGAHAEHLRGGGGSDHGIFGRNSRNRWKYVGNATTLQERKIDNFFLFFISPNKFL